MQEELVQVQWVSLHMQGASLNLTCYKTDLLDYCKIVDETMGFGKGCIDQHMFHGIRMIRGFCKK